MLLIVLNGAGLMTKALNAASKATISNTRKNISPETNGLNGATGFNNNEAIYFNTIK